VQSLMSRVTKGGKVPGEQQKASNISIDQSKKGKPYFFHRKKERQERSWRFRQLNMETLKERGAGSGGGTRLISEWGGTDS